MIMIPHYVGRAILFLELYLPYTGALVFFPFLLELSLTVITELTLSLLSSLSLP